MMVVLYRIIALIIGYFCGVFQTGYFYCKSKGIDIRQHGSGNSGTTNTLRTLGWGAGIITFIGDVLKCWIGIVVTWLIFRNLCEDYWLVICMYSGVGSVLGHNFPFYMKFKGGKGIACTAAIIALTCPIAGPLCILAFWLIVKITRYVSLGSIVVVSLYFVEVLIICLVAPYPIEPLASPYKWEYLILVFLLGAMAIVRHRANIKRLINGTENPFGPTKQEPAKEEK